MAFPQVHQITPCLWFDNQAEEAALFYTSVFPNSSVVQISRYNKEGQEIHGQEKGTVLTVSFILNGQTFTALNGGPLFQFNESVSFQVFCKTQEEIDFYWDRLTDNGQEGQCGWLKDKYGLSWQIIPEILPQLLSNPLKAEKATALFLKMKKLDIQALKGA
jgi:predicted 3-demethylubiquinone-9 3-methyltransferase (glyoxalase superfamily)